jgi:MoxR-like ATPase
MININEAKRLVKRAILANVVSEKRDLAITPLVSGKHGIGKSQMIKSLATDLDGICVTIEGGTLKEGEITGLPYQYRDENGKIKFRFLPYYAIERIQEEERRIFEEARGKTADVDFLKGDENRFALNNIPSEEKVNALKNGKVRPVIIFIDEINRTENTVYKELMNILLTRSVNGYEFPWWVFFVGAMNPSTQRSIYATNEMDPAQLDRFIKIKVGDSPSEWVKYSESVGISSDITNFIRDNPKCLSSDSIDLEDEEKPTPSPRGWDMIDTLLTSEPKLRDFFTKQENDSKIVERDFKNLVSAKLGVSVSTMFFASLVSKGQALRAEDIFSDDEDLSNISEVLAKLSPVKQVQTCDLMLIYLKDNIEFEMLNKDKFRIMKKQLSVMIGLLDFSTRLLFAQNLAATITNDGNNLFELLFDIFEQDLIAILDLSAQTRDLIEKS